MSIHKKQWVALVAFLSISTSIFSQENQGEAPVAKETAQEMNNPGRWQSFVADVRLGKGFVVETKDKTAKMSLHLRMQNQITMNLTDQFKLNETEAEVKRLRLSFKGYVYSPAFEYAIQLALSPSDIADLPNGNSNLVRDAVITYRPNSQWSIAFGQQKLMYNREQVSSSGSLQFVDRSIINSPFALNRDFGFFGKYDFKLKSDAHLIAYAALTLGEGPNFLEGSKSGFAYTGKLAYFPLGKFAGNGQDVEGSFIREEKPKLFFATAYQFNDRVLRTEGTAGDIIFPTNERSIHNYVAEMQFKYQSVAFIADWMMRKSSDPLIYEQGNVVNYTYAGNGVNIQGSYIFPKNWELAVRNATLLPDHIIQPYVGYELHNQTGFGITRYIAGHNLKIQADASYNYKKGLARSTYNPYGFRMQMQLVF